MCEITHGNILGGPSKEEIEKALKDGSNLTFTADNEEGKLVVIGSDFTDLKHPNVDRWKLNAKTANDGSLIVIYYIFPLQRGLYLFP